jgi:hypothetical protein
MISIEDPSDAELVAAVASVVRTPRAEPADSFVLHAPLELAARTALLPHVAMGERTSARAQSAAIAANYEAFGPAAPPQPMRAFESLEASAAWLGAALVAGDLDEVDVAATWLGRHAPNDRLAPLLADLVVPSLAAAAHGAIFLFLMPRVAPRGELTGELFRPLARELARNPSWRLEWIADRASGTDTSPATPSPATTAPAALFDALRATPQLGVPGSDFIYPLMSQVDRTGVARNLLSTTTSVDVQAAARVVLRAAALSMLQEPGDYAAYGWTHCLTMPQATLGIARWCKDPSVAVAVASTYVVGFRAALARNPLDAEWTPSDPGMDLATALENEPHLAAAAAWHAPAAQLGTITTLLATRAAVHHDAHLVKYTLACLDAADWDRAHARLYFSAAAALHGWWTTKDAATREAASASA